MNDPISKYIGDFESISPLSFENTLVAGSAAVGASSNVAATIMYDGIIEPLDNNIIRITKNIYKKPPNFFRERYLNIMWLQQKILRIFGVIRCRSLMKTYKSNDGFRYFGTKNHNAEMILDTIFENEIKIPQKYIVRSRIAGAVFAAGLMKIVIEVYEALV